MFFPNKYMADPKACRLEIFGPGLRFVVRPAVRTHTGLSSLSDWSHVNA